MLHFEADRDLAPAPAEVSAKLGDARFLVQCVPGAEQVKLADPEQAVCVLRPGFSFARGTIELTLRVLENVPSTATRLSLQSKGIGSSSDVEVVLSYTAHEGGTRLHWTADIKALGGLLKAVPQGLIKGAAQKVIEEMLANVEGKLRGKVQEPPSSSI